jgi:peptidoglycan/LPS O-acetylase OafA/YrhL
MGSAMAWAVHTNHPWLSKVFSKPVQLVCWTLFAIFILFKPLHLTSALSEEGHALVYACLIANVSNNPKTLIRLEWPLLKFLGRISYGLYLYHVPMMIVLAVCSGRFFKNLGHPDLGVVAAGATTYALTILVATLSLHWIERPFLKLKHKLARIPVTEGEPPRS